MNKKLIATVAFFLLNVTSTWAREAPMTNTMKIQQRAFEQQIGYDAALMHHVRNEVVQYDWQTVCTCPALPDWKLDKVEHTQSERGDVADEWTWYYRKSDEVIKAKVTSFRNNELAAMESIAEFAFKSSMAPPPFQRGPQDIGTISVVFEAPGRYTLDWAFRNLALMADGNNKPAVLAVAHCLQTVAASHTRPR